MKNVHIIGNYPPPVTGQTVVTERLARLLTRDHEVVRVTLTAAAPDTIQAEARLTAGKIRAYLAARRRLAETLEQAPDAPVIWTSISPMPLGHLRDWTTVMPALRRGGPVFAAVHWGNFDRLFTNRMTRASGRRLVSRLTGLVFLDEHLAERCAAWIPAPKRFVIPNTVDDELICTEEEIAEKQKSRQGERAFRLLYLSNMIASKGYADVLESIHVLKERGIDVAADFVGFWASNEDEKKFDDDVTRKGLADIVRHHGGISDRTRLKRLYLEASAFVLPTYYPTEAQPLSIIEALNAGTPVITTRHAGIPGMVRQDREALFVNPRDPQDIADAVERLLEFERWQRLSVSARERFIEKFSPEAVRSSWNALLHSE